MRRTEPLGRTPTPTTSMYMPSGHNVAVAPRPSRHIPALDGIRGLAVTMVLLYHFSIYQQYFTRPNPAWLRPASSLFELVSSMGWTGVDLFFVLSGFLITGILDDARGKDGYFSSFYRRRAQRILPLYYLVLAIHLVVLPRLVLPPWADLAYVIQHQGWYWSFLTNVLFARPHGWHRLTSHFWTLAIEEQFYLVWPLLVYRLRRDVLMRCCLVVIAASPMLRLGLLLLGTPPTTLYLLTPTELDGLLVGAYVALALRAGTKDSRVIQQGHRLTSVAILALSSIIVARHQLAFADPLVPVIGFSCLALIFGSVTYRGATAGKGSVVVAMLENRVLRFFGRYSYAIYLLHMTIMQLWSAPLRAEARMVRGGVAPFLAHLAYMSVVTGAIVCASLVTWHLIEQPFLRLRKPSQS